MPRGPNRVPERYVVPPSTLRYSYRVLLGASPSVTSTRTFSLRLHSSSASASTSGAMISSTNSAVKRIEKPHTYVKALIDKGLPVLLITNTPYCIKDIAGMIPEAPSIVLNLNLTPDLLAEGQAP